jgi:hypothetical protein
VTKALTRNLRPKPEGTIMNDITHTPRSGRPARRRDTQPFRMPASGGLPLADTASKSAIDVTLKLIHDCGPTYEPISAGARVAMVAQAALETWDLPFDVQTKLRYIALGSTPGAVFAYRSIWTVLEAVKDAGVDNPRLVEVLCGCAASLRWFVEEDLVRQWAMVAQFAHRRRSTAIRVHGWRIVVWGLACLLPIEWTRQQFRDALVKFHDAMSDADNRGNTERQTEAVNHGLSLAEAEAIIRHRTTELSDRPPTA